MRHARARTAALLLALFVVTIAFGVRGADLDSVREQALAGLHAEAASELRRILAADPGDDEARFLLARVLAWQEDYPAALVEYQRLLAAHPGHVDYLLGEAQTLLWSGRPAEALDPLEQAREAAPGYVMLWEVELQALEAMEEEGAGRRARELRAEAARRFPEREWSGRHEVSAAAETEFALGYRHEFLDNGYEDWQEWRLEASRRLPDGPTLFGVVRETERFSEQDRQLIGGAYLPLQPAWVLLLEADASPEHAVLPRWSLSAGLQRALAAGWSLHGGLRHTAYSDTDTLALRLGVERYLGSWRWAYAFSRTRVEEAGLANSHDLALDYFYGTGSRIGAGLTMGRELESTGAGERQVSRVRGVRLGGRHWTGRHWGVSWELGTYRQGDFYTRDGISLGLRYRY